MLAYDETLTEQGAAAHIAAIARLRDGLGAAEEVQKRSGRGSETVWEPLGRRGGP